MALCLVNIILIGIPVEVSVNTQSLVTNLPWKAWVCVTWLFLGVHASDKGLRGKMKTCSCACISDH